MYGVRRTVEEVWLAADAAEELYRALSGPRI
jgi:hypothetical protein